MRVTILAVGSRGDIQFLAALAQGLRAAGHQVVFATHAAYQEFVAEHGLDFAEMPADPFVGMNAGVGTEADAAERAREGQLSFRQRFEHALRHWAIGGLAAGSGADALIYAPLCFVGQYVADKLGLQAFRANYSPTTPTRAFPPVQSLWPSLNGTLNLLTYRIEEYAFWRRMHPIINRVRREALGLPPLPRGRIHPPGVQVLNAFSPLVVPPPPDWGAEVHTTGYWFLKRSADWAPPDDLLAFLREGPPPVYLGLGSMSNSNPAEVTYTILRALAQLGLRTIISPGQVDLAGRVMPRETFISTAPHEWLLPQTAAIISHSGPGTIAAALRAGRPTFGIPFFADQFFWSRRVHGLGVGPAPLPERQVSLERALPRIKALVEDPEMRRRAARLGEQLRAEDGVARAVEVVERQMATLARTPSRARAAAAGSLPGGGG